MDLLDNNDITLKIYNLGSRLRWDAVPTLYQGYGGLGSSVRETELPNIYLWTDLVAPTIAFMPQHDRHMGANIA